MSLGVHFTAKYLLGTSNRQLGHALTQRLADTCRILLDLDMRGSDNFLGFDSGLSLGRLDDLLGTTLRLSDQIGNLLLALAHRFSRMLRSKIQTLPATFRRSQAFGNLGCTLVESLDDGRPHEFHREQRENDKHSDLCQ